MAFLFRKTKQLEIRIDHFLDAISEGAIVFRCGVQDYLEGTDAFAQRIDTMQNLEQNADTLRKDVEIDLYSHSLIPDHRGDVLGILEHLDDVIDAGKRALNQFSIERPEIPADLHRLLLDLTEASSKATETVILAARAFFRDTRAVKDQLHKVKFFEREADRLEDMLKRKVFALGIDLSRKIQLCNFAGYVGAVSDAAEDAADRLAICTIKRSI